MPTHIDFPLIPWQDYIGFKSRYLYKKTKAKDSKTFSLLSG